MKLYLSSSRLGNHPEKLVSLFSLKPHVAVIFNAKDYLPELERKERLNEQIESLKSIGIESVELDLRKFKNAESLKTELQKYNGLWVVGGNSFLLRRAMLDSGFDLVIKKLIKDENFVYAGYSAGSVVTGKIMRGFELVDDMNAVKSIYNSEIVWDGLDIIPYSIAPHYQSGHHESANIEKVVEYFIKENIPYKILKDGQAIIINGAKEEIIE
jgi:dipeptidase E